MNYIFNNIRIIDPAHGIDYIRNVHIENGIITTISPDKIANTGTAKEIESSNMIMCPGLVDLHVHLREPGQEYKETILTGTNSAANGGFTCIVCMPNTSPDIDSLDVVEFIKQRPKNEAVDVLISAAITKKRKGFELTDMNSLSDAGVVLFTDDGAPVSGSEIMMKAFEYAGEKDLLLSQHCEEKHLTKNFTMNESKLSKSLNLKGYPSIAEEIILFRDIKMAEYAGNRRYHAQHLSTKGAVDIIRNAKKTNPNISCEVTPHHFVLSEENLQTFDANYKMNPPLRQNDDINAIIEGLIDGTVDCIATDHAPHAVNEKQIDIKEAANGILGLETALGLSITYLVGKNYISINRLIELLAVNPRKILRVPLVEIKEGEKANITIFSPDEEWTVKKELFQSKSENSPFINYKLKGKPKFVFNNYSSFESIL